MALIKGWSGGVMIGIGAALAAPVILPVAGALVKPIAKGLIWGYLAAADRLKEVAAETREQMNDLIAETKAEYSDGSGVPAARKTARPINA